MVKAASRSFEVKAPVGKVWALFEDMGKVAACIPGCESVQKTSKTEAEVTLRIKIGFIGKTMRMKAKIIELDPPSHMKFRGSSEDAEIMGEVDLKPTNETTTLVSYRMTVKPMSAIALTAISMLGESLIEDQTKAFADAVSTKLQV